MIVFVLACSQAMDPIGDDTDGPDDTDVPGPVLVLVNEILASNDEANTDEYGEYDDWFELYNPGGDDVDLAGWTLADDAVSHVIPGSLVVPAGGFQVIWCDDAADQGVAHVPFKLSGDGDVIRVIDALGTAIQDVPFGPQETDVSTGRSPDGGADWEAFDAPTPGASNG